MKLTPTLYNNIKYLVSNNGEIIEMNTKRDITKSLSLYDHWKIMACAFIGDIDMIPIPLDGDMNNICRRNTGYRIDSVVISDEICYINGVPFYKLLGYKHYYVSEYGISYSIITRKFVHINVKKFPHYVSISLVNDNGHRDTLRVHRVVYSALTKKPIKEFGDLNHLDSIPYHNVFYNLEEATDLENTRYAMKYGFRDYTWTEREIENICKLLSGGESILDIYQNYSNKCRYDGFKVLAHHLIAGTKFWKDISSKYDFSNYNKRSVKYSETDIRNICEMLQAGYSQIEISNTLGISIKYISSIYNRVLRTNISNEYSF